MVGIKPHIVGAATLVLGLAALLFAWLPGPPYRPDQFALPKDAILGAIGLCAALQLLARSEHWDTRIDLMFVAALGWGVFLLAAVATNVDLAWRSIGTVAAGFSLFVLARHVKAGRSK